ncbi:RNA-binding protein [Schizosaccharomyces cryophilus OY26]|uniref:RNA-binding protein n=1 Tax=Schizosaccharomyces cryophilus (strain OY26 / ATCC MYA-4695 / CBS 11777 / NBRC 106824 / NRRL Y48691) TaxID=653667 RepID=S9VWJ6_SCHCR|nr:RNA-binding protein [Schizosaccharomyces cryophilus OY26]EPY52028.1 RNA-binding protein [Schizosaccharomyces cryophilus OY26]
MAVIIEDGVPISSKQWENVQTEPAKVQPKPVPRKNKVVPDKRKKGKRHLSDEDAFVKFKALFGKKSARNDYMEQIPDHEADMLSLVEHDRHFSLEKEVKMSKKRKSKLQEPPALTKKHRKFKTKSVSKETSLTSKRQLDGQVVGSFAPTIEAGKGKKLLEMMGWSRGLGLGSENQGIKDPVAAVVKNNKRGLE